MKYAFIILIFASCSQPFKNYTPRQQEGFRFLEPYIDSLRQMDDYELSLLHSIASKIDVETNLQKLHDHAELKSKLEWSIDSIEYRYDIKPTNSITVHNVNDDILR